MGPVVGVVGAASVDLALSLLWSGDEGCPRPLATFDGKTGALRRRPLAPRTGCPLCGQTPRIVGIDATSYEGPACAG